MQQHNSLFAFSAYIWERPYHCSDEPGTTSANELLVVTHQMLIGLIRKKFLRWFFFVFQTGRPLQCRPIPPSDSCAAAVKDECESDDECLNTQMCCFDGCKRVCSEPVLYTNDALDSGQFYSAFKLILAALQLPRERKRKNVQKSWGAVFIWASKSNWFYITYAPWLASIRSTKPIVTLHVFPSSFDWFTVLSCSLWTG